MSDNPYDLKLAQAAYDAAFQRYHCLRDTRRYIQQQEKAARAIMLQRGLELGELRQLRLFPHEDC